MGPPFGGPLATASQLAVLKTLKLYSELISREIVPLETLRVVVFILLLKTGGKSAPWKKWNQDKKE